MFGFLYEWWTGLGVHLHNWWASVSPQEVFWLTFGALAQSMFFMRFVVQWIASERAKQSIVPEAFWYFSFAGGVSMFIYACYRVDPVFIVGQATGLFIYSRNIYLIWMRKLQVGGEAGKVPAE